jgi:CRP/FNR family transcriptional regulator
MKGNTGAVDLGHSVRNPLRSREPECHQCDLHSCNLGNGLSPEQLNSLNEIIHIRGPFQPGSAIYKMEDHFKSLFVVHSGSVKIQNVMSDGTKVVEGFYFSGDIFGMEAIGNKQYHYDAIALEPTWICHIPFEQLESLCCFNAQLQHRLLELLGQRIRQAHTIIGRGRYMKTDERLLLFLESLCKRKVMKDVVSRHESIYLPMTKGDIASYLALCPESLSRALRKLQDKGVIRNHKNRIEILDVDVAFNYICN